MSVSITQTIAPHWIQSRDCRLSRPGSALLGQIGLQYYLDKPESVSTHIIDSVVCLIDGVLVVLHPLHEALVEPVAVEVVAGDQRLQDEPQALLHHLRNNKRCFRYAINIA